MARRLQSRLKISGTLTTETALHVGGHGESPDTDLPLAQNGAGDFYIPGTSITGVLRAWCQKNFEHVPIPGNKTSLIDEIFGFQKGDDGQASFVIVEDIKLARGIESEIRDGVGINRIYGTAAEQAKFDRAILPRGTELTLAIIVEMQEASASKIKAIFGHLLTALSKGHLRFGAARTRGLGKVRLTKLKEIKEQEFNKILDWLNSNGSNRELVGAQIENEIATKLNPGAIANPSSRVLEITIKWQPKSSLMVKAGYDGIGVDMLPLTSGNGKDHVSLCLPGSSIKGAFRSHAERIVRTLIDHPSEPEFHEQIQVPLIGDLFGAKKEADKPHQPKSTRGLGALSIDDCYAEKVFDSDNWQSVEIAKVTKTANGKAQEITYTEQELWKALKKIENAGDLSSPTKDFEISHHVAIDRWTGGASEGALFSALQPSSTVKWNDICLTLDFSRLFLKNEETEVKERQKHLALMLLLLVLRDFAENRLPLGFATNRGMGEVEVEKVEITGIYNIVWENGEFHFKADEGLVNQDEMLGTRIRKEWIKWLSRNQTPNS
jgi:CRISPR/Cas system CSM-associated protein Csm3 (group 7 of RAMP superfamily)